MNHLSAEREAAAAVGHHAAPLGLADGLAQVGLARGAVRADAAFGGIQRDHVIAGRQRGHLGPHLDHHPGPFVAQDGREQAFGIVPGERKGVRMADARGLDLDHHLAGFGAVQLHRLDAQRLAGLDGHGGARFHVPTSLKFAWRYSIGLAPAATRADWRLILERQGPIPCCRPAAYRRGPP